MRLARSLAVALVGASLTLAPAAITPTPTSARDGEVRWTREVVVKGAPVTKRLAVCLDATGSMHGAPFEKAMREVLTVLSLFPDDGQLKVYAFRNGEVHSQGPGTRLIFHGYAPSIKVWRDVWTPMPDEEALRDLARWMAKDVGCSGNTDLAIAIDRAVENPEEDLSILLVSDGQHHAGDATPMLDHLATKARDRGVPLHTICVTTDGSEWGVNEMVEIAKRTGGTCVVWRGDGD